MQIFLLRTVHVYFKGKDPDYNEARLIETLNRKDPRAADLILEAASAENFEFPSAIPKHKLEPGFKLFEPAGKESSFWNGAQTRYFDKNAAPTTTREVGHAETEDAGALRITCNERLPVEERRQRSPTALVQSEQPTSVMDNQVALSTPLPEVAAGPSKDSAPQRPADTNGPEFSCYRNQAYSQSPRSFDTEDAIAVTPEVNHLRPKPFTLCPLEFLTLPNLITNTCS